MPITAQIETRSSTDAETLLRLSIDRNTLTAEDEGELAMLILNSGVEGHFNADEIALFCPIPERGGNAKPEPEPEPKPRKSRRGRPKATPDAPQAQAEEPVKISPEQFQQPSAKAETPAPTAPVEEALATTPPTAPANDLPADPFAEDPPPADEDAPGAVEDSAADPWAENDEQPADTAPAVVPTEVAGEPAGGTASDASASALLSDTVQVGDYIIRKVEHCSATAKREPAKVLEVDRANKQVKVPQGPVLFSILNAKYELCADPLGVTEAAA